MRTFVNDWHFDACDIDREENREYPVDEWIADVDESRIYLVSAYMYDAFVMLLYLFEARAEDAGATSGFSFAYEINHCKVDGYRGSLCRQQPPLTLPPEHELWQDRMFMTQYGEYDYIHGLLTDTGRIPAALQGKELVFKKDCIALAQPAHGIEHLAIYPQTHRFRQAAVAQTFRVPYGACDLKVTYTTDTGEESYLIFRELKLQNMLESFDENLEAYKAVREMPPGEIEELRINFDTTVLLLTLLRPEENRSFQFRAALRARAARTVSGTAIARGFFFRLSGDDRMEGELYRSAISLGETDGVPEDAYTITLEAVTDSYEIERRVLWERAYTPGIA